MSMSDPNATHATSQAAKTQAEVDHAQWMHRLRNELNTATMACAAAKALLATGAVELAEENLQRVGKACARTAALLDEAP
jgi:hypothetical protein